MSESNRQVVKRMVRSKNPRPKQSNPCAVCERYALITESHHLVDIGTISKVLHAHAISDWSPYIPTVWLCPNHHTLHHHLRRIKDTNSEQFRRFSNALSKDELDGLIAVMEETETIEKGVWEEVIRKLADMGWSESVKQLRLIREVREQNIEEKSEE